MKNYVHETRFWCVFFGPRVHAPEESFGFKNGVTELARQQRKQQQQRLFSIKRTSRSIKIMRLDLVFPAVSNCTVKVQNPHKAARTKSYSHVQHTHLAERGGSFLSLGATHVVGNLPEDMTTFTAPLILCRVCMWCSVHQTRSNGKTQQYYKGKRTREL